MRSGLREGIGRLRPLQYGLIWVVCGIGCAGPAGAGPGETGEADAPAVVRPGVDVLLQDSGHLVAGQRVGLITNHTGLTASGDRSIDALAAAPGVDLVALFSPEHGMRGSAEGGVALDGEADERTNLPIHSLYGETRKPTPAMLAGVDALLFDIQDIGARYYTYVSTMALAMEAAGEADIPFIVLDRPNPIGGRAMAGNVLDTAFSSFVGMYPVPMRHGMTAGELARLIAGEFGVRVDLRVVPASGWRRDMWYDDTTLPWIAPSPNMPDLESAAHYPGTCLFEGTNLSVGRGTDRPFQQIGAPWLEPGPVLDALADAALPGVRFDSVRFTPQQPGDGKYGGESLGGIRFMVTDRDRYDPVLAAITTLIAIRATHAMFEFNDAGFDRLAGTDRLRIDIENDAGAATIAGRWTEPLRSFSRLRQPYLLYH